LQSLVSVVYKLASKRVVVSQGRDRPVRHPSNPRNVLSPFSGRLEASDPALPLHDLAGLRGALAPADPRALRPGVPGARAAGPATHRRPLQRGCRAQRHLHHPGPHPPADPRERLRGHIRYRLGHEEGARLDGTDRAAVHMHTPVSPGGPGGPGHHGTASGDTRQSGL
jgi:hypothetical protein